MGDNGLNEFRFRKSALNRNGKFPHVPAFTETTYAYVRSDSRIKGLLLRSLYPDSGKRDRSLDSEARARLCGNYTE